MKILFLDESGDTNLRNVDPAYPFFVLGGIIVDEEHYETKIIPAVNDLKRMLFGRTDIILHTADISRNRNGFEGLIDTNFRQKFYKALNCLMQTVEYEILACVIDKKRHVEKYADNARDPYELSLDILVERFVYALKETMTQGKIIAEKRNSYQDKLLMEAWQNYLCRKGTYYLPETQIFSLIDRELKLVDKKDNVAGLQIADLVVTPIGRWAMGKKAHEDWEIIKTKFRKDSKTGRIEGYGLIVLPKG